MVSNTNEPKGITADALLRKRLREPTWVVPGLIPTGLSVWAGRPKVGKSWCAMALAVAVARGRPFLGSIPVEAGIVVYLALEDNLHRLQTRLSTVLQGGKPPRRLHFHIAWPRLDDGAIDLLDQWLEDHPGTRLVIVDTLARLRGASGRGGYRADYAMLEGLKSLADRRQVGLLLVHHLRKAATEDPFDQFAGSVGITAAPDALLLLSRPRGTERCVLRTTGRDVEERELGLLFVGGCFSLDGEGPEVRLSPERRAILEFVRGSGGPVAPHVVSTGLGLHPGGTRKLMVLMREQGVLVRADGGYLAARSTTEPPGSPEATPTPAAPSNIVPFKPRSAPPPAS